METMIQAKPVKVTWFAKILRALFGFSRAKPEVVKVDAIDELAYTDYLFHALMTAQEAINCAISEDEAEFESCFERYQGMTDEQKEYAFMYVLGQIASLTDDMIE